MGQSYRDELAAARHRATTLEAQLAEQSAAVDARDAELAELRARIAQLERTAVAPAPKKSHSATWFVAGAAGLVVVTAGMGWGLLRNEEPVITTQRVEAPKAAPVVVPAKQGRTLLWHGLATGADDDPNKTPAVVDANGDGIEDVVGMVYTPGKEGHIYVGAFDGNNAEPLWLSEPLGWLPEGIGDAFATVTNKVVLSHATDGTLRVHDVRTGKVRETQKPPHPVTQLCNSQDGPMAKLKVGPPIHWRDGKLAAGPGECFVPPPPEPFAKPQADDFVPTLFTRSADLAFAFGHTGRLQQPEVLAYHPTNGAVKWRVRASGDEQVLAAKPWTQHMFEFSNGCLYVEVKPAKLAANGAEATGERLLKCLNPNTGADQWVADIASSGIIASAFVPGKTRLMLARQTQLDVLDANGGKSLGYIGWH